jgi:hypothetical protein
MRQVMPHRNNIVAHCRCCKTFLQSMGARPLISGDCCNPVQTAGGVQTQIKLNHNSDL